MNYELDGRWSHPNHYSSILNVSWLCTTLTDMHMYFFITIIQLFSEKCPLIHRNHSSLALAELVYWDFVPFDVAAFEGDWHYCTILHLASK